MGLTFKENVPDRRNSKAFDVVKHLRDFDVNVIACDPLLEEGLITAENQKVLNINIDDVEQFDCALLINGHDQFKAVTLDVT